MRSKVIFRHPKGPPKLFFYRSDMARNAIESEIRTSKMADVSHYVKNFKKKLKLRIDVKWIEMRSKAIFGHPKWPFCEKFKTNLYWSKMPRNVKVNFGYPKWPTATILSKISKKNYVAYRSEMTRNEIQREFRASKMAAPSKMATGSHFVKK